MKKISSNSHRITISLPKDLLFDLMMLAHEQNVTLNQIVNDALREIIYNVKLVERLKKEYEFFK
jgi:metal-responsive CopG/Arc/MetJ family transcriptional regulator